MNYSQFINELNIELEKVCKWLEINRLSLNLLKTVAIDFSNKRHNDNRIILNNTPLEYVSFVKYLCVNIDRKWSFSNHIEVVCSKISKSIGIMYRLSSFCPKNTLTKHYCALIFPYLIYCNIIWGGAYPSHINKILLLQKRAIRIIHEAKFLDHTHQLFIQSNILKINEVHRYFCCLLAFKNKDKFPRSLNIVSTRNSNELQVTFQRLSVTQRSVTYAVPKYFNELPPDVKNVDSIPIFKRALKKYLLDKYNV